MRVPVFTIAHANVDDVDFSDVTTAVRTGPAVWAEDGTLDIPFDRDLTAVELAAVRRRLESRTTVLEGLREGCEAYLDLPTPTAAQNAAQLKRMTRVLLVLLQRHPN